MKKKKLKRNIKKLIDYNNNLENRLRVACDKVAEEYKRGRQEGFLEGGCTNVDKILKERKEEIERLENRIERFMLDIQQLNNSLLISRKEVDSFQHRQNIILQFTTESLRGTLGATELKKIILKIRQSILNNNAII